MNTESISGIFDGETRAHTRLVEEEKRRHTQEEAAKKLIMAARNSNLRENQATKNQLVCETVMKNGTEILIEALTKHKPAPDFSFAVQHLQKRLSSLPGRNKTNHHQQNFLPLLHHFICTKSAHI